MKPAWVVSISLLVLGCTARIGAQTIRVSCPFFFQDTSQRIACIEAIFDQDNYHFTLASVPPANGFGPGIVLTHTFRGTIGGGDEQVDLSANGAVTTNGSWSTGGDMTWSLPFRSSDTSTSESQLASATVKNWHGTALHLGATHRAAQAIYFYGQGAGSPATQYHFAEDDTWGGVDLRLPLSRQLVLVGGTGAEATTLPAETDPSAVASNFSAAQLPGLTEQPTYIHSQIGIESRIYTRASQQFKPLPVGNPRLQPLWYFDLENNAVMHWYHPGDGSALAFRQFRFDGDELVNLRAWLRNSFVPAKHPLVYHLLCHGSNKQTDECNLALFRMRSELLLSGASGANQVPFYLEPTLGGSDIENNTTLRGWDNYRFRDRDAAMVQFDSDFLVWDPFGVYVFYDSGTVGPDAGGLALSRWRQDAGVGVSARVMGSIVAQAYAAWGRGNGPQWGYNFAKVF